MRYNINLCEQYVSNIFDSYNYSPIIGENLENSILNTLIGTTGTLRLGAKPSIQTQSEILKRIHEKVRNGKKLVISSAWGTIKTLPLKNRSVDIAEYLALKQFLALSNAIKKVYPPGVCFNIFLGDSYYKYLYGVDPDIEKYCEDMEKLAMPYDELRVIRLSTLCKKNVNWEQQCKVNFEVLYKYWIDTEGLLAEQHENRLSYKEVNMLGWVGKITPAMREFYLKRMAQLYPSESYEFWVKKIVDFFAYGLMISQNDLMGRKNIETSTVDACLLRVPPPDLPRGLYSNRLRFRISPEVVMKSSAPPWTVSGIIKLEGYNPKIHLVNGNMLKRMDLSGTKYITMKMMNNAYINVPII